MAAEFYIGSFQIPSTATTQTITGVPFTPKGVIFFTSYATAQDAWENGNRFTTGFLDDSLNQVSSGHYMDDADVSADCARNFNTSRCISVINLSNFYVARAECTAITSDGFTLSWTEVSLGQRYINFIAIGGTGVSVAVGSVPSPGSAGNSAVTGVGFQPDAVLFCTPPFAAGTGVGANQHLSGPMFGWYTSGGQGVAAISANTNANPTATQRYQSDSECIARPGAGGLVVLAAGVSLDSDGFTLNWSAVSSGSRSGFMAISGVTPVTGLITQPTSTGNQSISVGVTPGVAIVISSHQTVDATQEEDFAGFSMGAYDGSSTAASTFVSDDNVSPSEVAQLTSTSQILSLLSPGNVNATGSSTTPDAQASMTFGSTSLEVNWGTADANQRLIPYLVLAATGGGGGASTFPALTVAY